MTDKRQQPCASEASAAPVDRRKFLGESVSCGAHIAAALTLAPLAARAAFAAPQLGDVVARAPFGRLERVGEGVWAMVSTPLEDRTTLSNGGIIAGTQGVVVVEGFGSVEGAQWMATKALEVTGMRPTHVVLTHYHADHSNGLAGYLNDGQSPEVIHTSKTEELLQASLRDRDLGGAQSPLSTLSPEGLLPDGAGGMVLDLGNREIRIRSLAGHTPSDLTVQVEDPRVVFCGDLVWNGMFPNYVDALPSRLWASCNELLRDDGAVYVPGHGSAARYGEIRSFLNVIEHVGEAAQRAFESGKTAAEGAADYSLPENLGEWFMFSPRYYEVAFGAWYRELRG